MNKNYQPGTIVSVIVWILIAYCSVTVTLLGQARHLPRSITIAHGTICALVLACHAKTLFSDPGAVPQCVMSVDSAGRSKYDIHTMCG